MYHRFTGSVFTISLWFHTQNGSGKATIVYCREESIRKHIVVSSPFPTYVSLSLFYYVYGFTPKMAIEKPRHPVAGFIIPTGIEFSLWCVAALLTALGAVCGVLIVLLRRCWPGPRDRGGVHPLAPPAPAIQHPHQVENCCSGSAIVHTNAFFEAPPGYSCIIHQDTSRHSCNMNSLVI